MSSPDDLNASQPAADSSPAASGAPHAPYVTETQAAGAAETARGRSHAWVWWLLGICVVLVLFAGSIGAVVWAAAGGSEGSDGFAFGADKIAVIPFDGTIAGTGGSPSVITPESFFKLLEKAEKDPEVKAIVLRVDSPGGTVAASEEISAYVRQAKKPVVVSVGDIDASGAYMVSSQADKIVANPGSAVGSIGVIMEIPNASALLDKIGVSFKVLTAGKYKDAGSPFRSLTGTETAMLQGQIDQVYGQFIDIVAEGRHLPRSEVASLATGWAWNGEEAKTLHLVDQIGTYQDALRVAARLGGIQGAYRTDVYANTGAFGDLLSSLLGIESSLRAIAANTPAAPISTGGSTLAK